MQSKASIRYGTWFVFNDGDDVIRAHGSCWTGIDRIYFNNDTVIQPYKRNNRYVFIRNNNKYQVVFCRHSVSQGQLRCTLFKNGEKIGDIRSKRLRILNFRPTLLHILTALGLGLLSGIADAPQWTGWFFVTASIALTLITSIKSDTFTVERII